MKGRKRTNAGNKGIAVKKGHQYHQCSKTTKHLQSHIFLVNNDLSDRKFRLTL